MMTLVRRLFWLGLLGGAGFGAWAAWQRRTEPTGAPTEPVWPPFDPATASPAPAPAFVALPPDEPVDPDDGSADASHAHRPTWVAPVGGQCPDGYQIKANDNSKIFHVPGGRFYERTVPERCYADAADAEADGYRRAKA
jgi:hypothetical protein